MDSDEKSRWWQPALNASPEQALAIEAVAGRQQRFAEVDDLAARLLTSALGGRPVAAVTRGTGPAQPDSVEVLGLGQQGKEFCAGAFGVLEQQQRGAWYLPQQLSLKAGTVNLPYLVCQRSAHALTLAADESVRVPLAEGGDAVQLWSLLIPLFDGLMEPIRVRAAGPVGSLEDQRQLWRGIEEYYRSLGIGPEALEVFRFEGGWHRLDRIGQQQARIHLLNAIAAADPAHLVARYRMMRLQALMTGFAKKAKAGTAPLARRVLTRALQPVVSGYFAGDWLAVLDYLQAAPHPDEEVITALPEPRLFVGMSAQAASMAAEQGIPEEEVHAMLAAFLGGPTSQSPIEERAGALREWWTAFDHLHAVQVPGMRSLWGLVDDGVMAFTGDKDDGVYTPHLYRQVVPQDVAHQVERLWQTMTLPRYPRSIVSNPRPHQLMAEALGPALEFWHGVALTAWFVCEGPYSRTPLSGIEDYYSRPLAALATAGCPVDLSLFEELRVAEQHLGPEQIREVGEESHVDTSYGPFTLTISHIAGMRREGFERLRDIINQHRRAWADTHLDTYLRRQWRSELEEVARSHHRVVAAKGRPPTLTQFGQFATAAANHWTGGDLGALYTAIGEPAPAEQHRPARLLTGAGVDFARRVYQALGGRPVDADMSTNRPEEAQRHWFLSRLAAESLRYLQLQEALGEPPTAKQFGTQRLTWPWPGEEAEGWPILQQTIASLAHTASPPPGAAYSPSETPQAAQNSNRSMQLLAKGANTVLRPGPVTVQISAASTPVDVSAVLLNGSGKVRDDHDFVFYNQPHHDGVHTNSDTVTADLDHIPADVQSIAVIVSIDLQAQPTATFDRHTPWRADISQPGQALRFQPDPFTAGETVTIATEIYRHTSGWKIRAVGQGYSTGLAGLATDYGINVA